VPEGHKLAFSFIILLAKNYPMFIFNIGDYIVHILSWLRSQKSIDTSISIDYDPWHSWFFNVSNGKLIWSDLYIWDLLLWKSNSIWCSQLVLHSNNAYEYFSKQFQTFMASHSILHHVPCPHTPQYDCRM
jgi:hypothetical protein